MPRKIKSGRVPTWSFSAKLADPALLPTVVVNDQEYFFDAEQSELRPTSRTTAWRNIGPPIHLDRTTVRVMANLIANTPDIQFVEKDGQLRIK